MIEATHRLIKLGGDNAGENRSNFDVGNIISGSYLHKPEIGKRFIFFHGTGLHKQRITSEVERIYEKSGIFGTRNSIYRLHKIQKNDNSKKEE